MYVVQGQATLSIESKTDFLQNIDLDYVCPVGSIMVAIRFCTDSSLIASSRQNCSTHSTLQPDL